MKIPYFHAFNYMNYTGTEVPV
ncbi:Protein of unknown function [Lactobacillus helveticus CIRM-BIA 951]|uniref:Uncharacterized protein n=1 Tax=Lactobacillus helveticus CIRM-BIA 951 TaxID=1226334 RepID=U6F226_LACHE|nr:Protein of unknown function [Lactobacillus helveticus CIRM-BIA 951]